jgi:uncharacterized membrane protein HdeD (DUF308 family)
MDRHFAIFIKKEINNMNAETVKVRNWGWWLLFGIIFIIIGLILLSSPIITTLATVIVFGYFLIIAGIINLIAAFLQRHTDHFWLYLVLSIIAFVVGILMLLSPTVTAVTLTLLLAAFFFCSGLFRIIGISVARIKGWGWYLLSGIISLLLGILILLQWPTSGLWVIGFFIGIDFLFAGWTLIMIALFYKRTLPSLSEQT